MLIYFACNITHYLKTVNRRAIIDFLINSRYLESEEAESLCCADYSSMKFKIQYFIAMSKRLMRIWLSAALKNRQQNIEAVHKTRTTSRSYRITS